MQLCVSFNVELLASFHIESPDGQGVKHLSCVVHALSPIVHVSEGLPKSLALELSLLQSLFDIHTVVAAKRGPGCTLSCSLNLLDQSLILLVKQSDISLEAVSLPLHIAINLSPFVLLLAVDGVFLVKQ